jgi:hypothetical protein
MGRACEQCTFVNEASSLACSVCGHELRDVKETTSCPRCTLANPPTATSCEACGADIVPASATWHCTACDRTSFDGWLECAHPACHTCHRSWIDSCDAEGREPTCLTCESERIAERRLSDASVASVLGRQAYEARAARLAERVCALYYCPSPACAQPFELDGGVAERATTCPSCKKSVVLRRTSAAELVGRVADEAAEGGGGCADDAGPARPDGAVAAAASASASTPSDGEATGESLAGVRRAHDPTEADLRALLGDIKSCPRCRLTVSKTYQSCNKFHCRCGHKFCWVCFALPDKNDKLKCACPKTGDEHGFLSREDIQSYRPGKRARQS